MAKNKNPLYVVKNKGKDVEQAFGLFDMILKKTGIDEFIKILHEIFVELMDFAARYGALDAIEPFINNIVEFIENLTNRFNPMKA